MTPNDCKYPTVHQTFCIVDNKRDQIVTALVERIKKLTDTECQVLAEINNADDYLVEEYTLNKSDFCKQWAHTTIDLFEALLSAPTQHAKN